MNPKQVTPEEITQTQHNALNLISTIKESEKLNTLESTYSNIKSENIVFRERKKKALIDAQDKVKKMENEFHDDTSISITEPVIVYVDGVFDIIHSGHFNAIRQAKKLCDILYVGVNSDKDVHLAKGPTLMTCDERSILAGACKWCDKVIPDTPYTPNIDLLNQIGAHYAAHGDDISPNEQGVDCYQEIKDQNRMKIFKRTEGISTTNLIGRLLVCGTTENKNLQINYKPLASKFLSTGWRLREFCNEKHPSSEEKVVYIDGAWDCLHVGHIKALEIAKSRGDFLYVGIYDDTTAHTYFGYGNPILSLLERTCNLLALKHVDDVVIGSPRIITEDLIKSLGISLVIGDESLYKDVENTENDPYMIPKKLGIFESIKSLYPLNNDILVKRLFDNKEAFLAKYEKKSLSEEKYYKSKTNETQEI